MQARFEVTKKYATAYEPTLKEDEAISSLRWRILANSLATARAFTAHLPR